MELAAYQPDIAPNLGAMIRLSACFGVDLHVIEPCGFPLSDKTLRRAAMDYTAKTRLTRHLEWSRYVASRDDASTQGRLVLLSTRSDHTLWDFNFEMSDTLLVGQESAGVPEEVRAACDFAVTIPMPGGGRSLNVAMAAGIALAEGLRQAQAGKGTAR